MKKISISFILKRITLIALAHQGHAEHERVLRWFASLIGTKSAGFATTPITEIGFVRVSIQVGFESNVADAVETLQGIKESSRVAFEMLADTVGADCLPRFVVGAKQVTDGHLLALAKASGMQLATLDKSIPGAFVVP